MRNLLLSVDKLNDISLCPRLYFYKHILRRVPEKREKYLAEGEFFHLLLHEYYSDKINGKNRPYIELAQNRALEYSDGLSIDESNVLIKLFADYMNYYVNEDWKILESEKPFAKVLYEDSRLDLRIVIRGRTDLFIETQAGFKAIVDHKLLSRNDPIPSRDNQKLCYCWAFDVRDAFMNVIGKQKTLPIKEKLHRPYFNYSSHQIEEWKDETIHLALDIMRFHDNDFWPVKFTGCFFHKVKCKYYDVCETTKDNRIYKLESGFIEREEYDVMEGVE